ncbi:MAG: peptide deformylase [Pelotomaculum sp.]|uniref:Peptide deformylase n=1 Tax=Pelotomaculum thermopropionicum (strain DSM 13744 / JCM 10971 / SI) TaxID=370438 RepID=DEF_PELTS|nr:RecName: Full=Peptide deformylase; Short=PDF; AltName: Full=Polypeptide deformylase [Pelotomaculum thermopropionicum SI]NPV72775.1 peptide deformylase [Pelotomaculum sp.]BAF59972.1 N-formylmethionyl-tRNA deformylase [Pelotomaculum thermopropionicum SI]
MAVYKIVELGDRILKERAKEVPKINQNIIKLLDNMAETMYHARGVGLAAPQIGVSKRVIVVDVGEGLLEMINPVITSCAGHETDSEGCLSIPGIVGDVTRASVIEVKGLDRRGKPLEVKAKGYLARALQHEIDHLDGILFIEKAKNIRKLVPKED